MAFGQFKTIYSVEKMSGWGSCSACAGKGGNGPVAPYYMKRGIGSPSLDGHSSEYHIGGSTAYSNALFWKSVRTQMGSAISSARHFIYDAYFYVKNPTAVQAIEFDVNQYVNHHALVLGTQCNVRAGHHWDIWDNPNKRWVSSGAYCPTPTAYKWHHVIVEVERVSGDKLRYVSITLDGSKHYLNRYYGPRSTSWTGVTLNFQIDGNSHQDDYSVWVNKLTFKYY